MFKMAEIQHVTGKGFLDGILALVSDGNAITEETYKTASGLILAIGGMGLFTAGRFIGSALMGWLKANVLLTWFALLSMVLTLIVIFEIGAISIIALCLIYLFMSIMFPTIFALGLKDLGSHTKRASSFLVMAIVGGAIFPALMGYIADKSSMSIGFIVPFLCFAVVFYYGFAGYKIKHKALSEKEL